MYPKYVIYFHILSICSIRVTVYILYSMHRIVSRHTRWEFQQGDGDPAEVNAAWFVQTHNIPGLLGKKH